MSVYNIEGNQLNAIYNALGTSLSTAYDIDTNVIFSNGPTPPTPSVEPMDWSGMLATYKANVNSVVEYAQSYVQSHANSYAFPILSDVHDRFYNEPNYVLYHYPTAFDKFLYLGDIANAYSQAQMDNAKAYMQESETINTLALIGNHELGGWVEGDTLPKVWYQPLLPQSAVIMSGTDALVYYFDDEINNVRFVCLDSCTPIYKSSGVQLLTKNELEFMASALESANGKDIILLNHSPGQSYYDVTDTEKATSISTTTVTNVGTLSAIINAFIDRESYTFSDDSSVSHTHDYTNATGKFIAYINGHTHQAGFNDTRGYINLICPSSYFNSDSAMSVFIVDKNLNKIIYLLGYKNQATYGIYEFTY